MAYARTVPVEFNHCDPAGDRLLSRYFEMVNSVVENFFLEAVDHSFARMMGEGAGVPTARIEADFRAPSRLGERLDFTLGVTRLGRASVTFAIAAACAGQHRWRLPSRSSGSPTGARPRLARRHPRAACRPSGWAPPMTSPHQFLHPAAWKPTRAIPTASRLGPRDLYRRHDRMERRSAVRDRRFRRPGPPGAANIVAVWPKAGRGRSISCA